MHTQNLHILTPRIMRRIFSQDGIATGPGNPEDSVEFTEKHIWPWFEPVIANVPKSSPGRHAVKNEEEVASFIRMAQLLGQTEPGYLAKMVKTRYPTFPHRNMVALIEPETYRDTGAAKKAATDWLSNAQNSESAHASLLCLVLTRVTNKTKLIE